MLQSVFFSGLSYGILYLILESSTSVGKLYNSGNIE